MCIISSLHRNLRFPRMGVQASRSPALAHSANHRSETAGAICTPERLSTRISPSVARERTFTALHYVTCNLADAFIQSDLQLTRLSRRHIPWSNLGLRALLKGPTAVQILSWPRRGSNHRPCGSISLGCAPMSTTLRSFQGPHGRLLYGPTPPQARLQ